jgi:hypothetical protein
MRWLLSILLICPAAFGSERVSIATPLVKLAPSDARLHEWCAAEGPYDACTRFVAFRLDAHCASDGNTWRIDASATFRPWILLRNMRSLPHEYLHIGDVRDAVEALIAALDGSAFEDESQCRARALIEQSSFESHLRAFARASNDRRHPTPNAISP